MSTIFDRLEIHKINELVGLLRSSQPDGSFEFYGQHIQASGYQFLNIQGIPFPLELDLCISSYNPKQRENFKVKLHQFPIHGGRLRLDFMCLQLMESKMEKQEMLIF